MNSTVVSLAATALTHDTGEDWSLGLSMWRQLVLHLCFSMCWRFLNVSVLYVCYVCIVLHTCWGITLSGLSPRVQELKQCASKYRAAWNEMRSNKVNPPPQSRCDCEHIHPLTPCCPTTTVCMHFINRTGKVQAAHVTLETGLQRNKPYPIRTLSWIHGPIACLAIQMTWDEQPAAELSELCLFYRATVLWSWQNCRWTTPLCVVPQTQLKTFPSWGCVFIITMVSLVFSLFKVTLTSPCLSQAGRTIQLSTEDRASVYPPHQLIMLSINSSCHLPFKPLSAPSDSAGCHLVDCCFVIQHLNITLPLYVSRTEIHT